MFDASVILFYAVVQVDIRPMHDLISQLKLSRFDEPTQLKVTMTESHTHYGDRQIKKFVCPRNVKLFQQLVSLILPKRPY